MQSREACEDNIDSAAVREPLYRNEAFEARLEQFGIAAKPLGVSIRSIAFFFFAAIVTAVVYSSIATYVVVATVAGRLWPDQGVIDIYASRAGTLSEYYVDVGRTIERGQRIGKVSFDSATRHDPSLYLAQSNLLQNQLQAQLAELETSERISRHQEAHAMYQHAALRRSLEFLREQVAYQVQVISTKRTVHDRFVEAADKGVISKLTIEQSYSELLGEERALSLLRMEEQSQLEAIKRAESQIISSKEEIRGFTARREGVLAASRERELMLQASNHLFLTSAISGVVIDLLPQVGGWVSPGEPVARVASSPTSLRAELWIPSESVGLIKVGSKVNIKLSSFPFQRYGTIGAQINSISDAPKRILAAEATTGLTSLWYQAEATLDAQVLSSHGREHRLVPGMNLVGEIALEQRRVISLIIDPFKRFL